MSGTIGGFEIDASLLFICTVTNYAALRSEMLIQTLTSAMLLDKARTSGLLTKNLFFRYMVSGDLLLLRLALIYVIFVNEINFRSNICWDQF